MRYARLQDRLYRGLGQAARHAGQWADAYRPISPHSPLAPEARYLRLPVIFEPLGSATGEDALDRIFWRGTLDGAYTKPGDYLVLNDEIFFVVSQAPFQPIICVRTNRIISIARSTLVPVGSNGSYGGFSPADTAAYLTEYPSAIRIETKMSPSAAGLPTDQAIPYWAVYLPAQAGITILAGDLVSDEIGRSAIISYADRSVMGWHLIAKMATA